MVATPTTFNLHAKYTKYALVTPFYKSYEVMQIEKADE